jgi:hypothetical protein
MLAGGFIIIWAAALQVRPSIQLYEHVFLLFLIYVHHIGYRYIYDACILRREGRHFAISSKRAMLIFDLCQVCILYDVCILRREARNFVISPKRAMLIFVRTVSYMMPVN